MFSLFCIAEIIEFPRAQNRKFDATCANHEYFEKMIFPWEGTFDKDDDSYDGIDNSRLIISDNDNETCTNKLQMNDQLRARNLDLYNFIRYLTGYQRNITYTIENEPGVCQCSFVSASSFGKSGHDGEGRCTEKNPLATQYCPKSNLATFGHKKMANGLLNLYKDESNEFKGHRKIILSPIMRGTSFCDAFANSKYITGADGFDVYVKAADYYTMGIEYDAANPEELPFIASLPPGFVPYYLFPSSFSFQSKDLTNPQISDIKVYRDGVQLNSKSPSYAFAAEPSIGSYAGYIFTPNEGIQEASFASGAPVRNFPRPGRVFTFEITNNGKTYRYNTTAVDCRQPNTYPDPPEIEPTNPGGNEPTNPGGNEPTNPGGNEPTNPGGNEPTNPGGNEPTNPSGNETSNPGGNETTNTGNNTTTDGLNPQKGDNNGDNQSSGLTKGQKAGISIGVILGVAVIVGVVVAILFVKGVIGAGGAAAAGDAAAEGGESAVDGAVDV